ncbi:hypothetical protein [Methylocystis echinoides]|uniref:Uncharacterized protein n=1 Tax=Methylocystis echinoides TaxID=29468 RepID=A0A9W6GUR1_9HYPH|nr:hypothetical protein [Methylocystis echinoides]GLI93244.1 hypothetical protein LMG27198_22360 [Methylocystis echinoides]
MSDPISAKTNVTITPSDEGKGPENSGEANPNPPSEMVRSLTSTNSRLAEFDAALEKISPKPLSPSPSPSPFPSASLPPFVERLQPERIEAFGGVYDVSSLNPGVAGSAQNPCAVYVNRAEMIEPILMHAVNTPIDQDRIAWSDTPLGATSKEFVASHSYGPCQAVVVFWKDSKESQQATLFHFLGITYSEQFGRVLNAVGVLHGGRVMNIDSVCHIVKKSGLAAEEITGNLMVRYARERGVPFHRIESKKERMAVAVDVQNATIATMHSPSLDLPTPSRNNRDKFLLKM